MADLTKSYLTYIRGKLWIGDEAIIQNHCREFENIKAVKLIMDRTGASIAEANAVRKTIEKEIK